MVTSCGSPYRHDVWSSNKLELQPAYAAAAYPLAGAWSGDGRTFAGGVDSAYGTDVRIYPAGSTTATRSYDFGSTSELLEPRGLALSADGSRAWAVTDVWNVPGSLALRVLGSTAAPSPTSLSLAADPPQVVVGAGTRIGGHLGSGGTTVGGAVLTVHRAATGAAPTLLPSVTTRADGTFWFDDTPPSAGSWTYTVSWSGDGTRAAASASTQVGRPYRPRDDGAPRPAAGVGHRDRLRDGRGG